MTMTNSAKDGLDLAMIVKVLLILCLIALPYVVPFNVWVAIPFIICPFMNDPLCRVIAVTLLIWQCIGARFLYRASDLKTWSLFALVFGLPALAFWMIGPPYFLIFRLTAPYTTDGIPVAAAQALKVGNDLYLLRLYCIRAWYLCGASPILGIVGTLATYPGFWLRKARQDRATAS